MTQHTMQPNRTANRLSGAILLAGLAAIALLGVSFWPWILVVLAVSILPVGYARGGVAGALIPALWLAGLVIAILADLFWPGLVALILLTVVLRTVVQARHS
jgi:hypothetical protein